MPGKRSRAGFTLIELLIVISILGVVVVPFIYLEVHYSERMKADLDRREMSEAGSLIMGWIGRDAREASSLDVSSGQESRNGAGLTIGKPDGLEVVYAYDPRLRTLVRSENRNGDETGSTILSRDVDLFETVRSEDAAVVSVRLELSRTLISRRQSVEVGGLFGRRMK